MGHSRLGVALPRPPLSRQTYGFTSTLSSPSRGHLGGDGVAGVGPGARAAEEGWGPGGRVPSPSRSVTRGGGRGSHGHMEAAPGSQHSWYTGGRQTPVPPALSMTHGPPGLPGPHGPAHSPRCCRLLPPPPPVLRAGWAGVQGRPPGQPRAWEGLGRELPVTGISVIKALSNPARRRRAPRCEQHPQTGPEKGLVGWEGAEGQH